MMNAASNPIDFSSEWAVTIVFVVVVVAVVICLALTPPMI